jgi:hypothetical protein
MDGTGTERVGKTFGEPNGLSYAASLGTRRRRTAGRKLRLRNGDTVH